MVENKRSGQSYFEIYTAEYFAFLEQEHFTLKETTPNMVKFSSKNIYVEVYYERLSHDIYVDIGLNEKKIHFNLNDILLYKRIPEAPVSWQSSKNKELQEGVRMWADYTKKYAQEFLQGDMQEFKRLKQYVDSKEKVAINLMERKRIESQVAYFWKNRNYKEVISLYKQMPGELTLLEDRKLRYAQKKIKNNK